MDILVSSNLERLLFEVSGRNGQTIADRTSNLAKNGEYSITQTELKKIQKDFYGGFASEDDTVEAMYDVFEEYGYAMDTHTGVALAIVNVYKEKEVDEKDTTPLIVLSTANPYKFPQDVLYALSGNDVKDSFKGVKRLNLLTAMKPPKALTELRYKPIRFKGALPNDLKKMSAAVLDFVGGNVIPEPTGKANNDE
jgi:threonine synthase